MKNHTISWGRHSLELGKRTCIMGILNVTPDSFSDGGKFFDIDASVAHAEKMVEAGADIIDIGGESTRPFSDTVPADEEARRVVPVIEKLAKNITVPISIDTTKAAVAEKALDAGASIINDVGALRLDPDLAGVAARFGVPVILMHMKGTPINMQKSPVYDNLIQEIKAFLQDAIDRAEKSNILKSNIIIDPGLGFGKTLEHNLLLLKNLNELESLDHPILIGASRKAFIRNLLKENKEKDIKPDSPIVEIGSQAAVAASIMNGAHIVRVHDVINTCATVKIIDAIKTIE